MKFFKSFLLLVLVTTVSLQCSLRKDSNKTNTAKRPNIIIFLADDLGYGNLQCYGSPNIRTPIIDSLATQGIRFTSYIANASCTPSRTQLLTGLYYERVHFGGGTGAGGHGGFPDSILTLAEGLRAAGYATGMAGKWHLGYQPKKYLPTNQGFDSWLGLPYSNDYKKPYVQTNVPLAMYRDTTIVEEPVNQDSLTMKYTIEAQHFIKNHSDDKTPFFFYLAYNMPHLPLHTTKRFLGQSKAGLFGDVVEKIDWSVGQVLNTLRKEGLAENTIVFFASDNGPWTDAPPRMYHKPKKPEGSNKSLWYRDNKHWDQGTAGSLRGAKGMTYEGGYRVPGIICWPGHIKPGQVSSALVTNLDIFRTFLNVGHSQEPDYSLDGYNMLPFFTGKVDSSPRNTYAYMRQGLNALRVGKWKLRVNTGTNEPQLFNLDVDPAERYNRAEEKPEVVKQIQKEMKKVAKEFDVKVNTEYKY